MARILGIDIHNSKVVGALVRTSVRKAEVIDYFVTTLRPTNHDEDRGEALKSAVSAMMQNITPPPDGTVVCLAGNQASVRSIELPVGAIKRIDDVLPFELEPLVPFDLEESVIHYQEVAREGTVATFLAAAAPKKIVGDFLELLREAKLDPRELAVGAAALDGLISIVPELKSPGPHLLIDFRDTETNVCIIDMGACVTARTISGGKDALQRAEHAQLAGELKRTLAGFRSQGVQTPVQAFLCGISADNDNALSWISQNLGVETRFLPLPQGPSVADTELPNFGMATALAARTASKAKLFDLRQGEFASQRAIGQLRRNAKLIAICACVVLMSFAFATFTRYRSLVSEREALGAQLAATTKTLFGESTESSKEARELLAGKRRSMDPLPTFDAYDVLDAISKAIPSDITHDARRLIIEMDDEARDGRWELQGSVSSIAERDTIAAKLAAHECFPKIKKGATSPGKDGKKDYKLEAEVLCPGAEPLIPKKSRKRGRNK